MALSKSVYGSVGTPRVYIDYVQYAKAIGYVKSYQERNMSGEIESVWDFDPSNIKTFVFEESNANLDNCGFDVIFNNSVIPNTQFGLLLGTTNYYGILGHTMGLDLGQKIGKCRCIGRELGQNYYAQNELVQKIVGNPNDPRELGYSLYKIPEYFKEKEFNKLGINFLNTDYHLSSNNTFVEGQNISLGALTIGRYFDFPHTVNLSMNIKFDAEGVTSKRTVGGSDITEINYTKPSWGNLAAWSNIDESDYGSLNFAITQEDYRPVSYKGRRSWDLTFSFLSKTDTFSKNMETNMSGDFSSYYGSDTYYWDENDSIIGSFITFTLNGQIPFLFQPDKTKQDFAMVKLKSNSFSVNQTAPLLYTAKMSFVEVW